MNKLFGIKLPTLGLKEEQKLYFHDKGNVVFDKTKLLLSKGATVTLDTYFNCFSFKHTKFTNIDSVIIALDIVGKGTIKINKVVLPKDFLYDHTYNEKESQIKKYLNVKGEETTLVTTKFDNKNKTRVELSVDLDKTSAGYIYAEIIADSNVEFFGGEYLTASPKKNTIKLGIVICTYRREDYVLSNLRRLKKYLEQNTQLSQQLEVFLIDNGKTISQQDLPIGNVYPNRNLGGSGGFTRGIVEVHKRKQEFSHFLLMDDDIVFDSEVFNRLVSILEHASDINNLCIGGTMLVLDKPYLQYENGANWGEMSILPNNRGFDMRDKQALLLSERDLKVEYNAWWFMCMPISKVDKYGLPLPMFIKADDIEYGLRCCDQIMTVNGLGIWHEAFDKKYSGELEYYIKRNEMILNAIHRPKIGAFFHIKKLIRAVGKQLVYQRYYASDLIYKAYNDFLKGADYFMNIDGEAMHNEIRTKVPKRQTAEELAKMGYNLTENVYTGKKSKWSYLKQLFTLNGYLIPTCFYNKQERKHGRTVDMYKAKPKDFYKSKTTIQYDIDKGNGFVTTKNPKELLKASINIVSISIKMLLKYKKTAQGYRDLVKLK